MNHWQWETGTPKERADTVRAHLAACHGDYEVLAKLFFLTGDGVRQILSGDIWRPEYSTERS